MAHNVIIVSHPDYAEARDSLLNQIMWPRSNIIVVINDSREESVEKAKDGMTIIHWKRNLYEYAAFMVPKIMEADHNDRFLLLHDTCSIGPDFHWRAKAAFGNFSGGITWISKTGTCNLCIFDRSVTEDAYDLFQHRPDVLDKHVAIAMEHNEHAASPKKWIGPKQQFMDVPVVDCGTERPYASGTERHIIYFPSLDIRKYYVRVHRTAGHPGVP